MSENTPVEGTIEVLQHLDNVDLTTIDRSRPVLKDGSYAVLIESIEVKNTKPTEKNPKAGHRLAIGLKMAQATKDEDGKDLDIEKFMLFDSVSLNPTKDYNPLERLADIQLACFGAQRKGFKPEDYIGQTALIKVKIEDSTEFGRQNRVSRWVPKKAGSAVGSAQTSTVGSL